MLSEVPYTKLMKSLVEIAERLDTGDPGVWKAVDQLVPEMSRLGSVALGDSRVQGFDLLGTVDFMIMLLTGEGIRLNRDEFSALLVAVVGTLRTFGAGFSPRTFRGKASVVWWFISRVFRGPFELERCKWESEKRSLQFYKVLTLYSLYVAVHGNSSHPMDFISRFFPEGEVRAVQGLLSEIVGGGRSSDYELTRTVAEDSLGVPDSIRDPPDGTQIGCYETQTVSGRSEDVSDGFSIPNSDDESGEVEGYPCIEIRYYQDSNGNIQAVVDLVR